MNSFFFLFDVYLATCKARPVALNTIVKRKYEATKKWKHVDKVVEGARQVLFMYLSLSQPLFTSVIF